MAVYTVLRQSAFARMRFCSTYARWRAPSSWRRRLLAHAGILQVLDYMHELQDMKDIEQMAGLRNAAAHGEFESLSKERAGLMEQQVNMFLARLRDLADGSPSPEP